MTTYFSCLTSFFPVWPSFETFPSICSARPLQIGNWAQMKKECVAFLEHASSKGLSAPAKKELQQFLVSLFNIPSQEEPSISLAEDLFQELIEREYSHHDGFVLLSLCFQALSEEDVKKWLDQKKGGIENLIHEAQLNAAYFEWHPMASGARPLSSIQRISKQISLMFASLIDTFSSIFVYWSEGRVPIGAHDRYAICVVLFQLITIPSHITAWIQGYLLLWQAVAFSFFINALAVGALCAYKMHKHPPLVIPDAVNLTDENCSPTFGRAQKVAQVVKAVLNPETPLYPLLIGDPRQGKTKITEKVAQFFAKSRKTFAVTPCSFGRGFDSIIAEWQQLLNRLTGCEHEVLLVLEEMDQSLGLQGGNYGKLSDFLKRAFEARRGIPTIAVTTLEGSASVEKDHAFSQRFKIKIEIDHLVEETVKLILQDYVYREVKDVRVAREAIEKAIELTKESLHERKVCRPDQAKTLLIQAINEVRFTYLHYDYVESEELKEKFLKHYYSYYQSIEDDVPANFDELENVRAEIATLENPDGKVQEIKKKLARLQWFVTQWISTSRATERLGALAHHSQNAQQRVSFWLQKRVVLPSLKRVIKKLDQTFSKEKVPTKVTPEVVESLLKASRN